MHRFFLEPAQCDGPILLLEDREAHHALHVLRLREGEPAEVLDGQGTRYECRVHGKDRRHVRLEIVKREVQPALPWRITLFQAIPKSKAMDLVVQKAAELGAARIVPLFTERVNGKITDTGSRLHKWRWIAVDAIKQCGTAWLPEIAPPAPPVEASRLHGPFDLAMLGSLEAARFHPRALLDEYASNHGRPPASLAVWIGPEGDFTPSEHATIVTGGARPITLGEHVLRSDTAALYSLSILSYEMQARHRGIRQP